MLRDGRSLLMNDNQLKALPDQKYKKKQKKNPESFNQNHRHF